MNPAFSRPRPTRAAAAPSLMLMGLEPLRAAWEYAHMRATHHRASLARGDGHPVVLFPGLASDQHAIAPLKAFCNDLGYAAHDWGRGFNTGPRGDAERWLDDLADDVLTLVAPSSESITLLGWSLGGIYAREVAKRLGSRARQVITIGSPFAGSGHDTNAGLVYRLLNGRDPVVDAALRKQMSTAPDVPTTSIYSRSDGVVSWRSCLQRGKRVDTENIEVFGSHCGLGWNVKVFEVLADRLSQPEGDWRPYTQRAPVSIASALLRT